ncbi:hypothetical protein RRG08_018321 [Elysia crispata]|uniref:Uncharacterized protein n=1 Tax=Elysia crispata TaxID=231223 RepID=A0AAE1AXK7_9GAST|nr:hypothetical protein RRG08_018321 [Elysia crispata]
MSCTADHFNVPGYYSEVRVAEDPIRFGVTGGTAVRNVPSAIVTGTGVWYLVLIYSTATTRGRAGLPCPPAAAASHRRMAQLVELWAHSRDVSGFDPRPIHLAVGVKPMPDHRPPDGAVGRALDSESGGFWVRSPADTSGGGSETHA